MTETTFLTVLTTTAVLLLALLAGWLVTRHDRPRHLPGSHAVDPSFRPPRSLLD